MELLKFSLISVTILLLLSVSTINFASCEGEEEAGDDGLISELSNDIEEEDVIENNVIVLTNLTLPFAMKVLPELMIMFYAPWCGPSRGLMPIYEEVATALKTEKSRVRLAKVDCDVYGDLRDKFEIRGFPTVILFLEEKPITYNGNRDYQMMLDWIHQKTGDIAVPLNSVEALEEFIARPTPPDVAVVGFFDSEDSPEAEQYRKALPFFNSQIFGIATDPDVAEAGGVAGGDAVVIFKKFDEERVELTDDLDADQIKEFITINSVPLLVPYNESTAELIFGSKFGLDVNNSIVITFMSEKEGHFSKYEAKLRQVAQDFKNQLLFVTANTDNEKIAPTLQVFGVSNDSLPAVRTVIFDRDAEQDMIKYKPTEDVLGNLDKFRSWLKDFKAGGLKPFLLSQPVPKDWDEKPVKVLVVSNFDMVTLDKNKNVLVKFYAPWCEHSKKLAPTYEKLAEVFKDNKDIVIAEVDAFHNEFESFTIDSFPTVKLYKKGENEEVEYDGTGTYEDLKKFLEKELGIESKEPQSPPASEEPAEKPKKKADKAAKKADKAAKKDAKDEL